MLRTLDLVPALLGSLSAIAIVGVLLFVWYTIGSKPPASPKIEARYEIWTTGVVTRRLLTDKWTKDNGFVRFIDKESGRAVAMPLCSVRIIEDTENGTP